MRRSGYLEWIILLKLLTKMDKIIIPSSIHSIFIFIILFRIKTTSFKFYFSSKEEEISFLYFTLYLVIVILEKYIITNHISIIKFL